MKNIFKRISTVIAAIASGGAAVSANSEPADVANSIDKLKLGNLASIIKPLFQGEVPRFFAGHRSHSSHASHGSHRSSSGGGYVSPTPAPSVPPVPAPIQPAPTQKFADPLGQRAKPSGTYAPAIPDSSRLQNDYVKRSEVIKRLQLKLQLLNVYAGPIDGVMGAETRDAIDLYKIKAGAKRGGYLDADTLTLFGITID